MANQAGQLNAVLVFGGDASKAVASVDKLNKNLTKLLGTLGRVNREGTNAQKGIKGFEMMSGVFKALHGGAQRFVDALRLTTQGLMSIGRAVTFFVALPLGAFFAMGSQTALTFEDQMIRVAKTTGLVGDGLKYVEDEIRRIARRAPTTHEQLGMMAEQAGQLGITAPDAIANFVEWMEILATTTDISADTVVEKMGKIGAAFGWNLNESQTEVIKLSNVINKLENDTAASAEEILTALYRLAPVASQLKITAYDAAALSAALISMGVSAESVGTQLSNMFIYMTQNSDKIAELAAGTEKYATQQDVLNAINEDAVGAMFDLLQVMVGAENNAAALAEAFELVGLRGGRALVGLGNNADDLTRILEIARKEWEEHKSLVIEYNKALESSKAHLQVLKNNINDVAITMGNTFMPVLNKAVEILIPAVRRLGKAFENLTMSNKLLVAGIAALILLGGPLLFFLSQIFFGFTMIGLAALKLFAALGGMVSMLWRLGGILKAVGLGAWGVVGAFLMLAVGVLKVLQNLGIDIAGFFSNLGAQAVAWGENLAAQIANGFVAGAVRYVVQAINYVANLIASFFRGASPPKAGPLKHIDKWGKTLIDTYFEGMKAADFGILEDISSQMENIFKNFAKIELIGETDQFVKLGKAREALAKLLSDFRRTGEISSKLLNDVVKDLGNAGDEIKKLIKLNLEYIQIEERLKELEQRRNQIQIDYGKNVEDIARSGEDPASRVRLFRRAMKERNNELRAIAKEEQLLEKQKEAAKEQLETMKAMVDAMQKQDDIQARLIDAMEKLAKVAGSLGGGGGGPLEGIGEIGTGGLDLPTPEEIQEMIGKPIIELEARIANGEKLLDAFLAGWKGLTLDIEGLSPEDAETAQKLFEFGSKLRGIWDAVTGVFIRVGEALEGISSSGDSFEGTLDSIGTALSGVINWVKTWMTYFAEGFTKGLRLDKLEKLRDAFDRIKESIARFGEAWKKATGGTFGQTILFVLGKVILFLNWIIGYGVGGLISGFADAAAILINFFAGVLDGITWVLDNLPKIIEWFKNLPENVGKFWEDLKARIIETVTSLVTSVTTWWENLGNRVSTGTSNFVEGIINFFKSIPMRIWQIMTFLPGIILGILGNILTSILDWLGVSEEIRVRWSAIWEDVKLIISTVIGHIIGIVQLWISNVISFLSSAWQIIVGLATIFWTMLQTGFSLAFDWIYGVVSGAITAVSSIISDTLSIIEITVQTTLDMWKQYFQDTWDGINALLETALESVRTNIIEPVEGIAEDLGAMVDTFVQIASDWIGGLIQGVKDKANELIESVTGVVESAIDKAKALLGISSPSDLFTDYGIAIVAGLQEGISKTKDAINSLVISWLESLSGVFEAFLTALLTKWNEYYQSLITTIIEPMNAAIENIYTTWSEAMSGKWEQFGIDWMTYFNTGLDSMKDDLVETIRDMVTDMIAELQPLIDKIKFIIDFANNPPSMPTLTVVTPGSTGTTTTTTASQITTGGLDLSTLPTASKGITSFSNPYGNFGGGNIEIDIDIGSIRDDKDIEKIADEVIRKLNAKLGLSLSFGAARR